MHQKWEQTSKDWKKARFLIRRFGDSRTIRELVDGSVGFAALLAAQ